MKRHCVYSEKDSETRRGRFLRYNEFIKSVLERKVVRKDDREKVPDNYLFQGHSTPDEYRDIRLRQQGLDL